MSQSLAAVRVTGFICDGLSFQDCGTFFDCGWLVRHSVLSVLIPWGLGAWKGVSMGGYGQWVLLAEHLEAGCRFCVISHDKGSPCLASNMIIYYLTFLPSLCTTTVLVCWLKLLIGILAQMLIRDCGVLYQDMHHIYIPLLSNPTDTTYNPCAAFQNPWNYWQLKLREN